MFRSELVVTCMLKKDQQSTVACCNKPTKTTIIFSAVKNASEAEVQYTCRSQATPSTLMDQATK